MSSRCSSSKTAAFTRSDHGVDSASSCRSRNTMLNQASRPMSSCKPSPWRLSRSREIPSRKICGRLRTIETIRLGISTLARFTPSSTRKSGACDGTYLSSDGNVRSATTRTVAAGWGLGKKPSGTGNGRFSDTISSTGNGGNTMLRTMERAKNSCGLSPLDAPGLHPSTGDSVTVAQPAIKLHNSTAT